MDSRIIKTKKGLKDEVIRLLENKPFEKITVSDICKESITSRITFYTYYQDKYDLADEMFDDYINEADANYHKMSKDLKQEKDSEINYELLLECILCLVYDNYAFFSHTGSTENPYLFSEFYNHVYRNVGDYMTRHKALVSNYPVHQTATLLCNGFFGVIHSCISDKLTEDKTREIASSMYRDILSSNIFKKRKAK